MKSEDQDMTACGRYGRILTVTLLMLVTACTVSRDVEGYGADTDAWPLPPPFVQLKTPIRFEHRNFGRIPTDYKHSLNRVKIDSGPEVERRFATVTAASQNFVPNARRTLLASLMEYEFELKCDRAYFRCRFTVQLKVEMKVVENNETLMSWVEFYTGRGKNEIGLLKLFSDPATQAIITGMFAAADSLLDNASKRLAVDGY